MCFHWVKAPTQEELLRLTHTLSHRVARFLERRGLLERDVENSYLVFEQQEEDVMQQLYGHSVSYRIAVGPHQGRKVFTLQTLLKTPCRDGTTHVLFEPLDFIARLAALAPKPRVNLTPFHGVFAPNSKHRIQLTPARRGKGSQQHTGTNA